MNAKGEDPEKGSPKVLRNVVPFSGRRDGDLLRGGRPTGIGREGRTMKRRKTLAGFLCILTAVFSAPAHSAELGQGGMSVVPPPLSPSAPTTPLPTSPLPSPSPGHSSGPTTPAFSGIPGLSRPQISPLASRLVLRTTPPGARVLFEGIDLGRTPLNADVPAGPNRRLVLLLDGYRPVRMRIRVEAGKILGMSLTLKPSRAPLRPPGKPGASSKP